MNLNIVFKKLDEIVDESSETKAIVEEARQVAKDAPELDELRRLAEWSDVVEPESYTVA